MVQPRLLYSVPPQGRLKLGSNSARPLPAPAVHGRSPLGLQREQQDMEWILSAAEKDMHAQLPHLVKTETWDGPDKITTISGMRQVPDP